MKYKAIIFDFDGTICDTGEGIMKSAKYALDAFGIECGDWRELSFFIGPPLLVTFQEKYNQSPTQADLLVKKYRERYTKVGLYESSLYPGIEKMLSNLKNDGFKLGIASSKPRSFVVELLEKFEILKYFDTVCAVSFKTDCESKQSIILRSLNELDESARDTLVVGDRFYDIDGAVENMADSAGVLWGYGTKFEFIEHRAKFIAEKVEDIEAIALGLYENTEKVQGIFSGNIIQIHLDDITLCDGTKGSRECVDHPGGVGIIGINDDDEVLMVRQFRYPYKEIVYEIPAGKLDKDEKPIDAGKREFMEECGCFADEFVPLGEIYPTPGYTNEIIRLFWAKGLHFDSQNLDEGEFLEVCKIKFDRLIDMIISGEIKDAKTIAAALKIKLIKESK